MFSTSFSTVAAELATAAGSLRASTTLLQQALDLVHDPRGNLVLRGLRQLPLAVVRHEGDRVVGRVEADAGSSHVVVDDEIDVLVGEHSPLPVEARLPGLGAEAHEHLPVSFLLTEQ